MPTLIDNLNEIASIKSDIRSAIEAKGVDMSSASFADYPSKIGEIQTGGTFVTETLSVTQNNTYYPGTGVDGFSEVIVNVPQSVEGYTEKQVTEGDFGIVNLNNSASYVRRAAFAYDSNLRSVNLPDCLLVQPEAFSQCSHIEQVNLPNCSYIDTYAFCRCSSMSYISIPNCRSLAQYVFSNCTGLSEIDIPICSIFGAGVFVNCTGLTSMNLPNCLAVPNYLFSGCTSLSYVSLPLTSTLGQNAFMGCSSLQTLTLCTETYKIPSYNTNIFSRTGSFITDGNIYVASDMYSRWIVSAGWSSLSSLFVSVNQSGPVLSYYSGVVYGITKYLDSTYSSSYLGISKADIVNVSLSNIKEINGDFFRSCSNLTYVDLPVCINISGFTFGSCSSLSEISLPMCEFIGREVFIGCKNLTKVGLPSCTYLSYGAFYGCSSLSEVSLPVCEYMSGNVFRGCINLLSVSLPVCEYIGDWAFSDCTSLSMVILNNSTLCSLGAGVFWSTFGKLSSVSIFVPSSLVEDYKVARNWSEYSSQIFPIPE